MKFGLWQFTKQALKRDLFALQSIVHTVDVARRGELSKSWPKLESSRVRQAKIVDMNNESRSSVGDISEAARS
jgi:hypothetical protein